MDKENKKILNMYIENVESDPDDATKVSFEAVILDDSISGNNVRVTKNALLSKKLLKSVKNKPIVVNLDNEEFGDHEVELRKDRNDNDIIYRNTVPIGVFTEDGYITTKQVDGEERLALVGKGVLWKSRFTDAVQYLQDMWNDGEQIPMSSEYLYVNPKFEDGVEVHDEYSNITLEGLCILNKDVTPAYDESTFTMLNSQMNELANNFMGLVAQVLNQEKGVNNLPVEEEVKEVQVNEEVEENKELQDKELQDKEELEENKELQVNEEESEVEKVEEDSVDYKSQVNELNEQITQLNATIEKLTNDTLTLAVDYEKSVETISQLNAQLEELIPFKEQILNSQREVKLQEATAKYSKALNDKTLESEDVKLLISQSIEDGEVGIKAKLELSELILNQFDTKKEEVKTQVNSISSDTIAGLATPKRENLLKDKEDVLAEYRV